MSYELLEGSDVWTYLWRLVVFDETAESALGGSQSAVQHVHVDLAGLVFCLQTTADFKSPALYK